MPLAPPPLATIESGANTASIPRRHAADGVSAFAVHPGMVATDLARHLTRESLAGVITRGDSLVEPIRSVEDGVATVLFAATAPEAADLGGAYLVDCGVAPVGTGPGAVAPHAIDAVAASRLWEASAALR